MKYLTFLLITFFCLPSLAWASDPQLDHEKASAFQFNNANTKAYQELLKLKLNTGKMLLVTSEEQSKGKINGIDTYLANCHDVIQLLITEDASLYDKLEDRAKERLGKLEDLDDSSPYYLFIQAEVQMQWALVKLKFGKRLAAIDDGITAYKLLKKNEEKFPDFIPNKKTLGACKVLLGSLPQQSKRWASLFGFKGNVKEGLEDMQEVIDSNSLFSLEAKVMKGFITAYILGEHEEALTLFKGLTNEYPDNQLFYFSAAVAAKNAGNAELALEMLENAPKGDEYCEFYFLDYLKSEACLLTGEYIKAVMYGKSFLQRFKGKNYRKDAYFKLFLAYWFLNDPNYLNYLDKIKKEGDDLVVPDQYALKFAEAGYLPNKTITKARLLHDGGEYQKALSLIGRVKPNELSELRDQTEYYYRKARTLHKLEHYDEAIETYKQVIAICPKDFPHYYGANSALQLGTLSWELSKDKRSALYYYNQVFEYTNHEYEGSMNNRAKALIAVLKD